MRIAPRKALLSLAALAFGCGGPATPRATPTPASGPHGGVAVRLPDEQGFGEVVIEPAPAVRGRGDRAQVAVYFLKADLKTPLTPLPTDVTVELLLPGGESANLRLSPQPKAQDPAGAGRVASPVGPYLVDQAMGELSASVGGRTFTSRFASPH